MKWIDKLVDVGCTFDWISPTIAAVRDVVEGPNVIIFVPEGRDWSGRRVARHLKRHGVRSWGHMTVNGHHMLTVRKGQAKWAKYLLDREGVPYSGPLSRQG